MTTENVPPRHELIDLIDRFSPLHAHAALLRDICGMLALDVRDIRSTINIEEMTPKGWYGLYLLSETVVDGIEQLDDAFTRMVTGNKV